MTPQNILAIAGSIALLLGLFGGGIKVKEIQVPTLTFLPRILLAIFGIGLIGIGITLPPEGYLKQPETTTEVPPQVPTISPTPIIKSYADTPRIGVATSSCVDPQIWAPDFAIDGNVNTVWSSNGHDSPANIEWIIVNMGQFENIGQIRVIPRDGGLGFPSDFKFQTSDDGTNWTDIPGQNYSDYPNQGSAEQIFTFDPVIARFVRMYANKLGTDQGNEYYYFQLEDIFPQRIVQ